MNFCCLCITGTDTNAGKTIITAGLARLARKKGLQTLVVKAVQTGAPRNCAGGLYSPDLAVCSSAAPGIEARAIELFQDACSPHLAARREGKALIAEKMAESILHVAQGLPVDLVLVEGAGGLFTPISESETLCDIFVRLDWPLLLVAANRLGAVNHMLLTLEAARARGLSCPGFVTNEVDSPVNALEGQLRLDNNSIIQQLGTTPCLASINHAPDLQSIVPAMWNRAWDALCSALEPVLQTALEQGRTDPPDSRLLDFDREHLWHPYTSATHPLPTREAVKTKGARIILKNGRELVDGMASWWCAIHGYGHPHLMDALRSQAGKMPHVMFGGLTHEPAVALAQKLLAAAPRGLEHVFFADSGSVSVEVAIKMALQYYQAAGSPQKKRLLTVRGGYHGDTLGAMSVCDFENGMHSLFSGILPQQLFAPRPTCRFDAPYDSTSEKEFEQALLAHAESTAAVILEPIVQGAGGMWFYHPEYLRRVHQLCKENGCLLILDEIATGFGRTGKMFACEYSGIAPDILCVGKGLTGGVMTLAATLATKEVAQGISAHGGVLMHGPTFMANPLACSVANASLELLDRGNWREAVGRMAIFLRDGLAPCVGREGVADVRVVGAIGVVEMDTAVNVERLQTYFVEQRGVWIRPFGTLLYVMPPYICSENDIAALTSAVCGAVQGGYWK